jgi:hypothetical protein
MRRQSPSVQINDRNFHVGDDASGGINSGSMNRAKIIGLTASDGESSDRESDNASNQLQQSPSPGKRHIQTGIVGKL